MAEEMTSEILVGSDHLIIPYWLEFKDIDSLSPQTIGDAVRAVNDWDKVYKFPWRLTIQGRESEVEDIPNLGKVKVLEKASHGLIAISENPNAYNIILHAMTHAYKPNNQELLSSPLTSNEGEIFGYSGLNVGYKHKDRKDQTFKLFEEGVCERNAALVNNLYLPPNAEYFGVGLFTMKLFPQNSEHEPQDLVMTSDVPGFVRKVLNIALDKPVKAEDIFRAMEIYSKIAERSNQLVYPKEIKKAFNEGSLLANL